MRPYPDRGPEPPEVFEDHKPMKMEIIIDGQTLTANTVEEMDKLSQVRQQDYLETIYDRGYVTGYGDARGY